MRSQKERNECRAWRRVVRVAAAGGWCSDISFREIRSASPCWPGHVMGLVTTLLHLRIHLWTQTAPSPADARPLPPPCPCLFSHRCAFPVPCRGRMAGEGTLTSVDSGVQDAAINHKAFPGFVMVALIPCCATPNSSRDLPISHQAAAFSGVLLSTHAPSDRSVTKSAPTDMRIVCSAYTPRAGAAQRFRLNSMQPIATRQRVNLI